MPQAGRVRVAVFDVMGRRVKTLVDAHRTVGGHKARFEAADLPSGTYGHHVGSHDRDPRAMTQNLPTFRRSDFRLLDLRRSTC
jgi:hypothetical protein